MAEERIRYQKLPGRRRGFLNGASVWQGPDHLLLVRSLRFREEYKRFYLGDIQSIAVADAPRFHISTRSFVIGAGWAILLSITSAVPQNWPVYVVLAIGLALASAWVYISAKCSCVCRIYTAVSGDDLPCVYRRWTARKFVQRVEAQIAAVQGAINGEWAAAVDARRIGPPEETAGGQLSGLPATAATVATAGVPVSAKRILPLSEIFVIMMFVDAAVGFATRTIVAPWRPWLTYSLLALELGLSIAMLIQHNRGRLRAGMQKLVLVSIIISGGMWYSRNFVAGVTGAINVRSGRPSLTGVATNSRAMRDVDSAAHVLWGLIGTVILLTQRERRPRGIIGGMTGVDHSEHESRIGDDLQ